MPKYGTSYGAQGINIHLDVNSLVDQLGAATSLSQAVDDPRYIDSIVDEAFKKADDTFNVWAEAYAKTASPTDVRGKISHMYEWGTVGINPSKSNLRMPASNPNARLWITLNEGQGFKRTVWFVYKPSVANVPKPNRKWTNMSSETINRLRDYVFHDKARVMEEGETVRISPKRRFLLRPIEKSQAFAFEQARPHDVKRGYRLQESDSIVDYKNNSHHYQAFTRFWAGFWEGRGAEIVEERINEVIYTDYTPELVPRRAHNSLRPAGSFSVTNAVAEKAKKTTNKVVRKARTRSMT